MVAALFCGKLELSLPLLSFDFKSGGIGGGGVETINN